MPKSCLQSLFLGAEAAFALGLTLCLAASLRGFFHFSCIFLYFLVYTFLMICLFT